jgi:hypothetical protein
VFLSSFFCVPSINHPVKPFYGLVYVSPDKIIVTSVFLEQGFKPSSKLNHWTS